jgi:hypothetical protein
LAREGEEGDKSLTGKQNRKGPFIDHNKKSLLMVKYKNKLMNETEKDRRDKCRKMRNTKETITKRQKDIRDKYRTAERHQIQI